MKKKTTALHPTHYLQSSSRLIVLAVLALLCPPIFLLAGTTFRGCLPRPCSQGPGVEVPQTSIDSILGHGTRKGNNLPYSMNG